MKKHIAFKIMLPLIVIFILTVTVIVSTYGGIIKKWRDFIFTAGNGYCNDYRNVCFGCKAAAEDTKTAQRYD